MRYALLVALREYAENVKTKGFWIGLILFPVMATIAIRVPALLNERATPTRHFVLVDQSGEFREVIEQSLERLHQRRVMIALTTVYMKKNLSPEFAETQGEEFNLEDVSAAGFDPQEFIEDFADANPGALDIFTDRGGQQAILAQMQSFLIEDAPPFEEPRRLYVEAPLPTGIAADGDAAEIAEALKPYLIGERKFFVDGRAISLFAAILIPPDIERRFVRPQGLAPPNLARGRGEGIEYWSVNLADTSLRDEIEKGVNAEVRRREYVRLGIDAQVAQNVQKTRAPMISLNPKKAAGREEVSMADIVRQWAPIGFVYLLWIAIMTISQMLLSNTIEEKSNRIIEVLLSSVTARELMMGKLMGIGAVGLTMIAAWGGSLFGVLWLSAGPEFEIAGQVFEVLRTSNLLPAFLGYFIFGFLLYAGMFLSIGSVCNTLKEAQNLMQPVFLIMFVPLITMFFIPKDPNGTLATFLSWIPLYTPFIMMNRAAADPPMFDLIGTGVLLVATTALVLWLAGKIFRIGILRTGQPPKLIELLRWLKA